MPEFGYQFVTEGGCTVSLRPAEHIGPGFLLALDMKAPGDGRHAEVYLDRESARTLHDALADMEAR